LPRYKVDMTTADGQSKTVTINAAHAVSAADAAKSVHCPLAQVDALTVVRERKPVTFDPEDVDKLADMVRFYQAQSVKYVPKVSADDAARILCKLESGE
jgi:hypothetical protein